MPNNNIMYWEECKQGCWVKEKVMGKGAFGSVTLWKNEQTGEKLCIKECFALELTDRHKEMWQKECKIMLRLKHPNIIQGLVTPPDLVSGPTELPVLALEYCEGGDLRQVLNKPENCCGLPELQVRAITRDISQAIEYLHSKQIVHRDVKPENIVLKPLSNNKFLYKLIDLGYAKDISAGSICKSFVGTEQYLAPELFTSTNFPGNSYNNNVDYWSLGTTVFECIVGFRPFFHGIPTFQWLQYVSRKKPDQICGIFNLDSDVVFSSTIPFPHYLCSYSTRMFQQWLQLMLKYEPDLRGGEIQNGRPYCFAFLDTILSTKVLHIYHVLDNRVLSYSIHDQSLSDILLQIYRESKIKLPEQIFLNGDGCFLHDSKQAFVCCEAEDEENLIFLIPEEPFQFTYRGRTEPELVKYILNQQSGLTQMPFEILKRGYSHFVYHVKGMNRDYKMLFQAQKALGIHLLEKKLELEKENTAVFACLVKLQAFMDFFATSIKIDFDKFQMTCIQNDKLPKLWKLTKEKMDQFITVKQEAEKLREKGVQLEKKAANMIMLSNEQVEDFGQHWEDKIIKIYQKIRKASKAEREKSEHDTSEISNCTKECREHFQQHMNKIYTQMQDMLYTKLYIKRLISLLKQVQEKLVLAQDKIIAFQKQRQTDIWSFVSSYALNVSSLDNKMYTRSESTSGNQTTFAVPQTGSPTTFAVPQTGNPTTFAVPQMGNPTTFTVPQTVAPHEVSQASVVSMQCSSSLVLQTTAECTSLKNESITNIKRIKRTIHEVETSQHSSAIPNWSFLDMKDDIM